MSTNEKQKLLFLFCILPKKHNVKVKGDSLFSEEREDGREDSVGGSASACA
jgi:hypothetical protein